MIKLIADSGATKAEWTLLTNGKKKTVVTQGISPYFFTEEKIITLLQEELLSKAPTAINAVNIHYYGTGMRNSDNVKMLQRAFKKVFKSSKIEINDDMVSAARALNGAKRELPVTLVQDLFVATIMVKKIVKQTPGIGYVLGDEGSGAYLGKKVLQYYMYNTFDEDLRFKFDDKYKTSPVEVLENVYRKPLANRYLAGFTLFLVENRGHYMIENIIEDGLNDFFFAHLCKYKEVWTMPVNFIGSVAFGFKDVLQQLCNSYEFELGKIMKNPMQGLVDYHR